MSELSSVEGLTKRPLAATRLPQVDYFFEACLSPFMVVMETMN
jgi:hypothetical protein